MISVPRLSAISAKVTCRAEFYDLDPMQIVWHGNYTKFMEQARCALMDRIGYNYDEMVQSGYAWPIVDLRIKYIKPVRWAEPIEVEATLIEFENRLKVDYRIRLAATGAVLTKAMTTQLAVEVATGELSFVCPDVFTKKVRSLLG
jgi:acyl-CoA thioester hydrolase